MKTLLKTLFLTMAIGVTASAFADSQVTVSFFKVDPGQKDDGAPIADGSSLNTAQDIFVAIIDTNPQNFVSFAISDGPALGGASDIQTPNFPASVTFAHPGYDFSSCYNTSYNVSYQPTQNPDTDPTHIGYLGADGNRSFCLVRLHYAPSGTPGLLTVEAQNNGGSTSNLTVSTLNLA